MQSIEQLFTIENTFDETLNDYIFARVDGHYKLFPCTAAIMNAPSIEIFKRSVNLSDLMPFMGSFLIDASALPLPAQFNVSITEIGAATFECKSVACCLTAEDFYKLICEAGEACVDIGQLLENQAYLIWLAQIEKNAVKQWKDKKYYLSNSDGYILGESVLRVDPVVLAEQTDASHYPVGNETSATNTATPTKDFSVYVPIPWEPMLTEEQWLTLFNYLYTNDATSVANRIIQAILPNPGTYPEFLRGKILPMLFANSPTLTERMYWYAARIMFRDELSMFQKRDRGVAGYFLRQVDDVCGIAVMDPVKKHEPVGDYFHPYVKYTNTQRNFDLPASISGPRGLYSRAESADRIGRFTQGIFDNVRWSGVSADGEPWKIALTGSTIAACTIVNPLQQGLTDEEYWEEYYPSHSCEIVGSNATGVGYSDIDIAIECSISNFATIAERFIAELIAPTQLHVEKVEAGTTYWKYLVSGVRRTVEIFHTPNIARCVVKYHAAPVRAFWTGTNLWCFPTFVSVAYTGISADFRWHPTAKNPCDIVLKYFQRGFGFQFTKADCDALVNHIKNSESGSGAVWLRNGNTFGSGFGAYYSRDVWIFNPSTNNVGIHTDLDKPSTTVDVILGKICYQTPTAYINKLVRDVMGTKSIKIYPHLLV